MPVDGHRNEKEWENLSEGPRQEWRDDISLPTYNVMWKKALLLVHKTRFIFQVDSWAPWKSSLFPSECQTSGKEHKS